MANAKISALPAATTPLTGSEELPIVQSGVTDKVTVANLTAGRALAASTTTITSANAAALAVGANGATNPVLSVNAATGSVATGVTVVGAAATGGVNVAAISSGTNENLTINAKGSGTITLNNTATGNVVMGQNVTVSKGIAFTAQSLSGAGAVNVTTTTTLFTSGATGDALTLADGVAGQIKTVIYVAEAAGADTGVLTPTNRLGYSSITLTNVGDSVTLQFTGTAWAVLSAHGATVNA